MKDKPHIFWPKDIGPYESELYHLLGRISDLNNVPKTCEQILSHINSLPYYPNAELPRLRYRAYLFVMVDLLRQGSTYIYQQGRLYISPPNWAESATDPVTILANKQAIREALSFERLAQFQKPSVRSFIKMMEFPRVYQGQVVSIRSLFADGAQLASDLTAVATIVDKAAQKQAICSVIKPYLQIVPPETRCEHVGLRLIDIWRYMRYTWAIPYNSTPGRNMYYFGRDAARPYHPVIGSAAFN